MLGAVRVAVTNEVPVVRRDGRLQQCAVVAVQESDAEIAQFQCSKATVASAASPFDCRPQIGFVTVHVSKDKVRSPVGKQFWDFDRPDVATVDYHIDGERLQHPHGIQGVLEMPVGVADDAQVDGLDCHVRLFLVLLSMRRRFGAILR